MGEENNKITAKRVPKEQIEKNSNLNACAKALLDQNVRLLISAKDDTGAEYYRVAHEALFTHWELAQKTITRHTKDIQLRDQLEKSSKRWKLAKKEDKKSLLLQDGLPLNEAVDLVERRESELDGLLVEFVRASEERVRRSKRLNRLFWGTLLSVSLLVSFFMYGLKKEADRVTDKLVNIVSMYSNEGLNRFEKDKNQSMKIFEAIIENFEDSQNNEIRRSVSIGYVVKWVNYNEKKEYDKAIEAYQKAIEINPKKDEAYYIIGNAYYHQKKYDKAIEAYQKAIEINPKNNGVYTMIGNIYNDKKEYDKAIKNYKQAIKISFKNNVASTHIMKSLYQTNSIVYFNMGIIYHNNKEYDKAIEAFQKVIEIKPKVNRTYYELGEVYIDKEEYDKAIEVYQKAIDINPKDSFSYLKIGYVYYYYKKEYDKAIESFQKGIEINPKYDDIYFAMGSVYYFYKKEYDKAIKAYQKVIEINPKYHQVYFVMGSIYSYENEYDKARECYKESFKLDINSSGFLNFYELQLITNKDINKSIEKNYIANFKSKKEKFIVYEMLKIIKDLSQNKKVDLKAWQSKYEGVYLDWGFDELDEWVKTLKDEALKKKINEALEVFKGHG